jgi:hypothetical protein
VQTARNNAAGTPSFALADVEDRSSNLTQGSSVEAYLQVGQVAKAAEHVGDHSDVGHAWFYRDSSVQIPTRSCVTL